MLRCSAAPLCNREASGTIKQMSFLINSPLEQFEITSLLSIQIPLLGYLNIAVTNIALYSILALSIIFSLHYFSNNNNKLVPSKWSIALESLFTTISSIVRDQIGITNERYLPLIYSLFVFILIANLIGNIPYNFTVTTSLIVSIGLSVTIFIGVTNVAIASDQDVVAILETQVRNTHHSEMVSSSNRFCFREMTLGWIFAWQSKPPLREFM